MRYSIFDTLYGSLEQVFYHTSIMERLIEHIIDDSIETEQTEGGRKTVDAFTRGVEHRVQERTGQFRGHFGQHVDTLLGTALQEAQSYRQAKLRLLDPHYQIADTKKEGAAAWYEPGSGEAVFDDSTMEHDIDREYWSGVRRHEEVHKDEQAHRFNRSDVEFDGEVIAVHPVLIEWHAIRASGQSSGDLSSEYIEHARRGDALAAYIGKDAVVAALKSGDIAALQEKIYAKERNEGISEQCSKNPT